MAFHGPQHVRDRDEAAGLGGQAGNPSILDAAGDDPVEPTEVAVAVEREAVHGDPARYPDADRRNLAVERAAGAAAAGDPHPAAALDPGGGHAHLGAGTDQRLLDGAHVGDHIHRLGERDDRVADKLTRPVPGDLPAAVHVDHGDARIGEWAVELAGPPSGRVDGPVLQEQARVRNVPADPPFVQALLEGPAIGVGNRARAEPGPRKNELATHGISLSGTQPRPASRRARQRPCQCSWCGTGRGGGTG